MNLSLNFYKKQRTCKQKPTIITLGKNTRVTTIIAMLSQTLTDQNTAKAYYRDGPQDQLQSYLLFLNMFGIKKKILSPHKHEDITK